jgi:hypothetical protein
MQVLLHAKQPAMGVDDLGFGLFLDLLTLFILSNHKDAHSQDDAFTSPSIGGLRHRLELPHRAYILPSSGVVRLAYQAGVPAKHQGIAESIVKPREFRPRFGGNQAAALV